MKKLCIILSLLTSYTTYAQVTQVSDAMYPFDFIVKVNGVLLFFAADKTTPANYELWRSDGTTAGTYLVKDINGNNDGSILSNGEFGESYTDRDFVVFKDELYFIATDGPHGLEIWKSDGTADGTVMLKDIYPGANGYLTPEFNFPYFTELNDKLYFAANDGVHGFELWETDGTEAGTQMVKDISADNIYGSNPEHLIAFDGKLYFAGRDDADGYEIFSSDGTAAGTSVVKDIVSGINGSMNNGFASSIDPLFTVSGDYLYFVARVDATLPVLKKLHRTDGTSAGTILLNNDLYDIANLCDVNGTLFFYALDGVFDHSTLWKSDGTETGTEIVNTSTVYVSNIGHAFYSFNDLLYFSGFTVDFTEYGLGKSDGTAAGTTMVHGFESVGSIPETYNYNAEPGSNYFFYHALTKISDFEMSVRLVQTNGTDLGTKVFSGAMPFRSTAFLDGDIYFGGIDSTAESVWGLYKITPEELAIPVLNIPTTEILNVFPNPSNNNITIQLPENISEITICDMVGNIVTKEKNNTNSLTIDVSDWAAGIYTIFGYQSANLYRCNFEVIK